MKYPSLAFKVGKTLKFIAQTEIMYCCADGNYTEITLADNAKIPTYKSLKELELILDKDYFIRVHHKYIVNIMYVINFNGMQNDISLQNNINIELSRRKRKDFLAKFHRL